MKRILSVFLVLSLFLSVLPAVEKYEEEGETYFVFSEIELEYFLNDAVDEAVTEAVGEVTKEKDLEINEEAQRRVEAEIQKTNTEIAFEEYKETSRIVTIAVGVGSFVLGVAGTSYVFSLLN